MAEGNANTRLEAFSDGVFAIAMTLLVIDLKLPDIEAIHTSEDLWHALQHLAPIFFAFLLSFVIVFITWVNHHAALRLVHKSTGSFIYANGLLLLTVVFIPFPTSLLGEFILTDHAAPAVVLYNSVLVVQGLAWLLLGKTALGNNLTIDERSAALLAENTRHSYFAIAFYGILAVTAVWLPTAAAIVTTISWLFWLTLSVRSKHA